MEIDSLPDDDPDNACGTDVFAPYRAMVFVTLDGAVQFFDQLGICANPIRHDLKIPGVDTGIVYRDPRGFGFKLTAAGMILAKLGSVSAYLQRIRGDIDI